MKQLLTLLILIFCLLPLKAENNATFAVYDVVVDSDDEKLAAWQFTLDYNKNDVKIVGIEGGKSPSFPVSKPPAYDPKGLTAGKIILANYSLNKELQSGKQIVAKLHLFLQNNQKPIFKISNIIGANNDGKRIKLKVKITK